MPKLTCPYCHSDAEKSPSSRVYKNSNFGMLYVCKNYPQCDSFVGTHKKSGEPKGSLANKELREWRKRVHGIIDPLWLSNTMSRNAVYWTVQKLINLPAEEAHIGMFTLEQCKTLIKKWPSYLVPEHEEVNQNPELIKKLDL